MLQEKSVRVPLWDNLKFILITMVVIGHFIDQFYSGVYQSIFIFIYTVHMPLFIFVSGLFHSNRKIAGKVVGYMSLYVLLKLVIYVIRLLFTGSASFNLFKEAGIPWYMFSMAVFVLVTWLIRDLNPVPILVICLVLACLAGLDPSIGDYFVLSRTIVFYPFYLAGTMIRRERLEKLNHNTGLKIASLVFLLALLYVCFFHRDLIYFLRPLFTGKNPYSDAMSVSGPFYRILCYLISTLTGTAFIILCPNVKIPCVTAFGSRTLQIYFWHRPALYILVYSGCMDLFSGSAIGKAAWIILAIAFAFLFGVKIFGFPAQTIMKKIN